MLVLRAACPDHAVSFAQLGGGGGEGGRDIDAVTSSQTSAPSALHKGEGRREGGRNIASPPPPSAPKGKETKAAFKQRLRRAAMATSTRTVRRALLSIKKRAQAIFDADGGDIDFD